MFLTVAEVEKHRFGYCLGSHSLFPLGRVSHQLFVILQQQFMKLLHFPLPFLHRFRCQQQELCAGVEEATSIAGGLGCLQLVSRQHPDLHACRMEGFDGFCRKILESAGKSVERTQPMGGDLPQSSLSILPFSQEGQITGFLLFQKRGPSEHVGRKQLSYTNQPTEDSKDKKTM